MERPKKLRYYPGRFDKRLIKLMLAENGKLIEAQTNLKQLIGSISERLNVLKVEEHQLRSMVAQTQLTQPETKFDPSTSTKSFDFDTSTDVINQQDLDLDVKAADIFKQFEEEYDDE